MAGPACRLNPDPSGVTMSHQESMGAPRQTLGFLEAIAIVVGIVIGAGIFKAPSLVAMNSPSEAWLMTAWVLGGVISIIGALCYCELATAYPSAGGDYHFLHRAFGRQVSFVFAWCRFSVITTGSIALLAFVFGDYMTQVLPLGTYSSAIWAVGSVLALTWLNVRGIRQGAPAPVLLTGREVAGRQQRVGMKIRCERLRDAIQLSRLI
jgi:amino acid transporter